LPASDENAFLSGGQDAEYLDYGKGNNKRGSGSKKYQALYHPNHESSKRQFGNRGLAGHARHKTADDGVFD